MVPGLQDELPLPSRPAEALQRHIAGNFSTYYTSRLLSTSFLTANLPPSQPPASLPLHGPQSRAGQPASTFTLNRGFCGWLGMPCFRGSIHTPPVPVSTRRSPWSVNASPTKPSRAHLLCLHGHSRST